jgi:cyclic beta-1,2-glucan synthetase
MAGDVYSAPPYVGRGGWSWYTGSAAWMHRAAIESMFGLRQHGDELSFEPCLPSHWNEAELVLTRAGRKLRVVFLRHDGRPPAERAAAYSARLLGTGQAVRWSTLGPVACCVMLMGTTASGAAAQHPTNLVQPA